MVKDSFWHGRRVLVTGNTGFKGAWLSLWLEQLGAKIAAFALPPRTDPSLYALAAPWTDQDHVFSDIRDAAAVHQSVARAAPEIVFHLAAQPIVRAAYHEPIATYATNVMGTVHVLDAVRQQPTVRAVVIVTSDKVYDTVGAERAFVETDSLGGSEPYGSSKACAELAVRAYRASFLSDDRGPAVATARAGNVIGGGDWAADRLVPDIIRALTAGGPIELRYPDAVRPWQHVLDALSGYLLLAEHLFMTPSTAPAAVNFGPEPGASLTVASMVAAIGEALDAPLGWIAAPGPHPSEAPYLALNSSLARERLGWVPRLSIGETVQWTAEWYRAWRHGANVRELTQHQIAAYDAKVANA